MSVEEADDWVPETRFGYVRLFYFGSFLGVICVGGNSALHSLWLSIVQSVAKF